MKVAAKAGAQARLNKAAAAEAQPGPEEDVEEEALELCRQVFIFFFTFTVYLLHFETCLPLQRSC